MDRAIYSLPLNQPFVIACEEPGFSNTVCEVVYKKNGQQINYVVNPDNRPYFFNTQAQSIKEIIEEDKAIQQKVVEGIITNYPWQN